MLIEAKRSAETVNETAKRLAAATHGIGTDDGQQVVYVYVQFQSMNGREKFLQEMNISAFDRLRYRLFDSEKYE